MKKLKEKKSWYLVMLNYKKGQEVELVCMRMVPEQMQDSIYMHENAEVAKYEQMRHATYVWITSW